jgi:hypothetical protein
MFTSRRTPRPIEPEGDEEQLFLAKIVAMSPEEQQTAIQRREAYRRMAQRQGIMEIEHSRN